MAIVLLAAVWKMVGCFFETNDDRFIAEVLSGALGGVPEAHVVYVNYILSYPLSLLYKLCGGVPWYGLMLLWFQILVYTALFHSVCSRGKTLADRVMAVGFIGSCILLNLYITAAVQYTSTAALMAVTGYICLLLNRSSKGRWFLFCFFETMAFLLRDQAMLMIQPIGIAVCVSEFLGEKEREIRERLKKVCCLLSMVAAVILAGLLGTLAGYRGEEWSEFRRFNQARTALFDYYGTPEYEEVKSILDQYEVSPAEYEAFRQFVLLGQKIDTECMEALAEYQKEAQEERAAVSEAIREIPRVRGREEYYGVGKAAAVIWCAVYIWLLMRRRTAAVLSLSSLAVGSIIIEAYLIYRGRLPLRVMLPLFCGEIFLAIAVLLRDNTGGERNMRHCVMMGIMTAALIVICVASGRQQYHSLRWEQTWQEYYTEGLVEVQEYCRANPEKRFILEIGSFSDYRGNVLETRLAGEQNCVYSGSWLFHSPVMNDFLQNYLDSGEENFCLILHNNEFGEEHYAVAFFAQTMGESPVLADKFGVSNGAEYLVWEFGE